MFLRALDIIMILASCRTMTEKISLHDQIILLMNHRQYDEVLRNIEALPAETKNSPEYLLIKSQALYGKAGYDLIKMTKLIDLSLNLKGVENALTGILKTQLKTTPPSTAGAPALAQTLTPDLSSTQISFVRSFFSLAGYFKILENIPSITEDTRPLLMESLIAVNQVPMDYLKDFKKARTQSLLVHMTIFISSLKKSLKQNPDGTYSQDLICALDPPAFTSELNWMAEHLLSGLDDIETVLKIQDGDKYKPGNMPEIRQKIEMFRNDPNIMNAQAMIISLDSVRKTQC